jgi:ligand-binding sensor domain-containing protein
MRIVNYYHYHPPSVTSLLSFSFFILPPLSLLNLKITITSALLQKIFLFVLFFLTGVAATAQQARQYVFTHFSLANGLASNIASGVVQDRDGYIWIATLNGLQRYDGNSFLTFQPKPGDPFSVPTDQIPVLFSDSQKNIWMIGTDNRTGIFDTRKFTFTEVPVVPAQKDIYTRKYFFESAGHTLWLHEEKGNLYQYDATANRFSLANDSIPAPKGWKRNNIVADKSKRQFWMSSDSGIAVYNTATRRLNYRNHNPDNDAAITACGHLTFVNNLFAGDSGSLIFSQWPAGGSTPDLYRFFPKENELKQFNLSNELGLTYHEISGLLQERNNRLWVYGSSFLAEWVAQPQKPFLPIPNSYGNEQSIKFDRIYSTFEDRERNIWLATDNGVFYFNPDAQVFNSYQLVRPGQSFREAPVQTVLQAVDGRIFVGSWGAGLFCFDKNLNPLPLPSSLNNLKNSSVYDMRQQSRSGKIWITLQGGSLMVYDTATRHSIMVTPDIFNNQNIRQIVEDPDGNMWLGTQDGKVIKWNSITSEGDPAKGYEPVTKTGTVYKLHTDPQGYIWVAALGQGLLKINPKTKLVEKTISENGTPGFRLFNNAPTDMTQYTDSMMVVSAGCINLVNLKTNKVTFIGTAEGLPSNTARCVQRDKNLIMWIGMANGLCRLNMEKKIINYFDRRDGINYDNFTIAGVEKLQDGRIIFFTDHDFVAFDPENFRRANQPPKPVITGFSIAGKPLLVDSLQQTDKLVLRYNNSSLTIDFSGLSFIKQKKFHYFYKLQGLDKDWIHTDNRTQVVYNYLPPGEYVFKVISENADGITSEETALMPIVVRAPVWRLWWFYALIFLLVVLVLFLIDRERMKRMKSLQQMRTQIAGNLHHEINTTLNKINVLSEIAKIKADKNIEQSKAFIDQISDQSRCMIEAMDDILWSIDPENDSMKKSLLRIKEVTEGFGTTYNANIDLTVEDKVQTLRLDMKVRHELFFFYKETISFLLQQACCRQLFISIKQSGPKLLLEILSECTTDDQDLETALKRQVDERATAIGASLDIIADKNKISVVLSIVV